MQHPSIKGLGLRKRPPFSGRRPMDWLPERLVHLREMAYAVAAEPFRGITADGQVRADLFPLAPTGCPTQPIMHAAQAYLDSLDDHQRDRAQLAVDAAEWMTWSNISPFVMRHGVLLETLSEPQRQAALGVIEASLSASGYQTTRDAMRLNETIGEITGAWDEYGEWVYWLTIFGAPSPDQPWGWQLDGHHCNLNCFIAGDQLVLTPAFLGAEPVYAESGKYAGTRVFEPEEQRGLEVIRSLSAEQQARAIAARRDSGNLPPGRLQPNQEHVQSGAQQDNIQLPYEGIRFDDMDAAGQAALLRLIQVYVGRLRTGHDQVKMDQVCAHLDETYFLWYGDTTDESAFYYRIHSPVLLIEFDHQSGVAFDNDTPSRVHVHTVVRTPNGNDYGKDLLRQHYARFH